MSAMDNPPVVTLFATAIRETRADLDEVASRFLGRVNELTAQASGTLASRVDGMGERVSSGVEDLVGRLSAHVGDRIVELGEALAGAAADRGAGESAER
ncbi:MAG: hypothetical protein J2P19_27360 [Pseudonocardia sp.]|nr:hypothetical protein [Pseudonocardia sp.]